MTHTGKIGRLPKKVRDQLNQRLDDGQSADDILSWLNKIPEVKAVLKEKFGSRPITPQNLSQWKSGGYQTWLRLQQAREQVQPLLEQTQDTEKDNESLADRLGPLLVAQLLTAFQQLEDITDPDERWQRFKDISHELGRVRREDHHRHRVRLAQEQWDNKRARQAAQDEKDKKEAERGRLIAWAYSLFMKKDSIESHGGGEMGRRWADWFHRVRNGLPLPTWFPGPWADTDFGPDGTNWSKVIFPPSYRNEPRSSSSSSSSSSKKESPSQGTAGLATRPDSNTVGQASCLSPSSENAEAVTSPRVRTESIKANQSKSNPPHVVNPTRRDSNTVGQASCLSPSSGKPECSAPSQNGKPSEPVPTPDTRHSSPATDPA